MATATQCTEAVKGIATAENDARNSTETALSWAAGCPSSPAPAGPPRHLLQHGPQPGTQPAATQEQQDNHLCPGPAAAA